MTTAAEFQAKVDKAVTNFDRLDVIVNGSDVATVATYHGIVTGSSVTDLLIRATCGKSKSGATSQGYGVVLGASNDRFIVDGNMQGNVTGTVSGPTASATKVYRNI